jgi:hypothetical protein
MTEILVKNLTTGVTTVFKCPIGIKTKDIVFDFSLKVSESTKHNYYSRRHNSLHKIVTDHYFGKLGEFGVCNFLWTKNVPFTPPDLLIYTGKTKSYDADLKFTGTTGHVWRIHVKCQPVNSQLQFGLAWLFQKEDELTFFAKDNDLIAFCSINDKEEILIHKVCKAYELKGKFDTEVFNKKRIKYDYLHSVPDFKSY